MKLPDLTVTEAAHCLGVSEVRVRQLIKSQKLLATKSDGRWVIPLSSIIHRRSEMRWPVSTPDYNRAVVQSRGIRGTVMMRKVP